MWTKGWLNDWINLSVTRLFVDQPLASPGSAKTQLISTGDKCFFALFVILLVVCPSNSVSVQMFAFVNCVCAFQGVWCWWILMKRYKYRLYKPTMETYVAAELAFSTVAHKSALNIFPSLQYSTLHYTILCCRTV